MHELTSWLGYTDRESHLHLVTWLIGLYNKDNHLYPQTEQLVCESWQTAVVVNMWDCYYSLQIISDELKKGKDTLHLYGSPPGTRFLTTLPRLPEALGVTEVLLGGGREH